MVPVEVVVVIIFVGTFLGFSIGVGVCGGLFEYLKRRSELAHDLKLKEMELIFQREPK